MIVELCGADLLSLVNGSQVAIGDVIVRPTEAEKSNVTGAAAQAAPRARPERGGNRRTNLKRKSGAHVIPSRFDDNRCADCTTTWNKGEPMIYDYDGRKPYCLTHGVERFPELKSEVPA
jgi:hypothetical protein